MNIREILNRLDRINENQDDRDSYEDDLEKSGVELPGEKPEGMDDQEDNKLTGHDDSGENLDNEEESPTAKRFKQYAKDIGGDMFSLSMWDYTECWEDASFGSNGKIKTIIENLAEETMDGKDDAVVKKYVKQSSRTLLTDRIFTQIIYDARHKRLFNLKASVEDGVETSDIDFLEQDQADILQSAFDLLDDWIEAISNSDAYNGDSSEWYMLKNKNQEWSAMEDKVLETLNVQLPQEKDIRGGGMTQKQKDNLNIDEIIQFSLDLGDIETARKIFNKHQDHPNLKKDWSKELSPRAKRK